MSSKPTSHLLQKVYAFSSMYLHSTHSKSGQCQATTKWTWREATYQACSKQKWSGPARLLNFLLVVWIQEQAKQVIIYLWPQGAWKVFHFLVIRKCSKAQQDTVFFCENEHLGTYSSLVDVACLLPWEQYLWTYRIACYGLVDEPVVKCGWVKPDQPNC